MLEKNFKQAKTREAATRLYVYYATYYLLHKPYKLQKLESIYMNKIKSFERRV